MDRRTFLRGAAGTAATLPFLELLASNTARAQGMSTPRLVVFMTPQGFLMDEWLPTGQGNAFELSPLLAPLEPFRSKLNILSGIDNDVNYVNRLSNGHNSAARTLLTCMPFAQNLDGSGNVRPQSQQVDNGFAGGPSIDQVIASRIGGQTRRRSLNLGIGGDRVFETQILHAGYDDPIRLQSDPRAVFQSLFADLEVDDAPPPPSTPRERIMARRGTILDKVNRSFAHVKARAGAEDLRRLEAHAEKVAQLEQRFRTDPGQVTALCQKPTVQVPGDYQPSSHAFDVVTAPVMTDLLVMALTCDMTRVGTLQFVEYQDNTFPWLGGDIPGQWSNWHSMIHEARNSGGRERMRRAMVWYAEQFAYLLQEMDAVDEGNGTLLDNSLVMWVSDFGDGSAHATSDMPFVLAGGLGGALPTGRHIAYQRNTTGDLYTALLRLFGGTDTTFGLGEYCSGPLPGLV